MSKGIFSCRGTGGARASPPAAARSKSEVATPAAGGCTAASGGLRAALENESSARRGKVPEAVIFLDIDGVLHSLYGTDLFRESCCNLFEQIVRATGAIIVLSSTWRTQARSVAMVNALLKRLRLQPIYDRTKDLSASLRRHVPREVEVCEWLDRHPEVSRWIAIDDMDLQGDSTEAAARMRGHFVRTNSNTGLVPLNAEQALRLMQAQEKAQCSTARKARACGSGGEQRGAGGVEPRGERKGASEPRNSAGGPQAGPDLRSISRARPRRHQRAA